MSERSCTYAGPHPSLPGMFTLHTCWLTLTMCAPAPVHTLRFTPLDSHLLVEHYDVRPGGDCKVDVGCAEWPHAREEDLAEGRGRWG